MQKEVWGETEREMFRELFLLPKGLWMNELGRTKPGASSPRGFLLPRGFKDLGPFSLAFPSAFVGIRIRNGTARTPVNTCIGFWQRSWWLCLPHYRVGWSCFSLKPPYWEPGTVTIFTLNVFSWFLFLYLFLFCVTKFPLPFQRVSVYQLHWIHFLWY